jgi:hypothetical protein
MLPSGIDKKENRTHTKKGDCIQHSRQLARPQTGLHHHQHTHTLWKTLAFILSILDFETEKK